MTALRRRGQDPANLAAVREKLAVEGVTAEQRHVLAIMEKTFKVNIIEDPRAAALKVAAPHPPHAPTWRGELIWRFDRV